MSQETSGKPIETGEIEVQVSRDIVSHLSFGIYKNFARAIRELIYNSYDAHATEIRIGLDLDSIPPNLVPHPNMLPFTNTESNGPYLSNCKKYDMVHPARFPVIAPEFFIRFLTTRKSQVVLDAFAGSNSTGYAAEKLGRKWVAFKKSEEYLKGSMFRFFNPIDVEKMWLQNQNPVMDENFTPTSGTKSTSRLKL